MKMTNKICILLQVTILMIVVNSGVTGAKFRKMSAVTYNVALHDTIVSEAYQIPNTRLQRREQIIEMLNNTDADLICLQEVWIGEDVEAIVNGVSEKFPYSFSKIHKKNTVDGSPRPRDGPLCDGSLLEAFYTCSTVNGCLNTTYSSMVQCMFVNCVGQFVTVITTESQDCLSCLLVSFADVSITLKQCGGIGQDPTLIKMNSPGLLLLSKDKLRKPSYVEYFPRTKAVITRGYLTAKVRGLPTVCTHLSALFEPYLEAFLAPVYNLSSYAEQNLYEVNSLISTFGDLKRILLLGDFNTGVLGDDTIGDLQDSYNLLASVFDTTSVTECTFCAKPENPYNGVNSYIIDHIFGKGVNIRRVKRTYTQNDPYGSISYNATTLPLSDHYGVEALISRVKK